MLNKNVETFLGCDADYHEADTVLYGAPFDSTTSYRPGTRFGSRAIRMESFGIETYSPYQDKDLMDRKIFDSGDLELCFGDTRRALEDIEHRCAVILNDGKRPFLLGGEHPHTSVYFLQHYLNNNFNNMTYSRLSVAAILLFAGMMVLVAVLYRMQSEDGEAVL